MRGRIFLSAIALTIVGSVSVASAQSAATCSFDAANARVNVTVNGLATDVRVAAGVILVDGVPCGEATTANTDRVHVQGSALSEKVNVSGAFAPGLTAEGDGNEEIELTFALGQGSSDRVVYTLSNEDDIAIFDNDGADLGGDGDEDLIFTGTESVALRGRNGHDILDGTLFRRSLLLYGDLGDDTLIGGDLADQLYGGEGSDTLEGGLGNDIVDGEAGSDVEMGGAGNDTFNQGAAANGADTLIGGTGVDLVSYSLRTAPLTVTLDSSGGADGEAGENDSVGADVEQANGGSANDSLSGASGANTLRGKGGDDTLVGKGGKDVLDGGDGSDTLDGGLGINTLRGGNGNDTLIGNASAAEVFAGGEGDDTITGLADGLVETVTCGGGNDTVEDTDEDTFVDCEIFN